MQKQKCKKTRSKVMRRIKKCVRVCTVAAAVVVQFAGCSATELEDRCFPMMAAVDYRDDQVAFAYGFPQLSQKDNTDVKEGKIDAPVTRGQDFDAAVVKFHQELEKKADCNHMKVFVVSKELIGQPEVFGKMLEQLRKSEIFPRNVYVCVAQDVDALFETEPELSSDLGSYLETFLFNHEEEKGVELTNLGTLLDEQQNHIKTLELPYLVVEDGTILWDGMYRITHHET